MVRGQRRVKGANFTQFIISIRYGGSSFWDLAASCCCFCFLPAWPKIALRIRHVIRPSSRARPQKDLLRNVPPLHPTPLSSPLSATLCFLHFSLHSTPLATLFYSFLFFVFLSWQPAGGKCCK